MSECAYLHVYGLAKEEIKVDIRKINTMGKIHREELSMERGSLMGQTTIWELGEFYLVLRAIAFIMAVGASNACAPEACLTPHGYRHWQMPSTSDRQGEKEHCVIQ